MSRHVRFAQLALALVMALSLLGVGGAAAQEVPREETLIVAFEGGPAAAADVFNPFVPGSAGLSRGLHQAVIEHLFYLNYETGETVPWLAESFETNADFTEYTIKLREGIEWSDGEPFTAADVAFTYNMLRDNPTLSWGAGFQTWVKSAEAVDDLTVKITLNKTNPRFILQYLSCEIWGGPPIVPQHIWEGQDPTTFRFETPVFTGAYTLTQATTTEFIFDRNDNWWGAKTGFHALPAPKRVIFVDQGPEERRAAMIQNNEVDSLPLLSIGAFEAVKAQNPNVIGWSEESPYAYIDPCPHYFEFNTTVAPWDDPEMRWMLSNTIDRQRMADLVFEGTGVSGVWDFPAYPPLNAYLEGIQDLFEQYPLGQDLDKAAQILESKGYTKNADGKWADASGNPLVVRLMMLRPDEGGIVWGTSTSALSEMFEEAGLTVEVNALSIAAFQEAMAVGDFEVRMGWACGSTVDPYGRLDYYNARWVMPIGERASYNDGRWSNEEYSAVVDEMGTLPPGDEGLKPLFHQAAETFLKELPAFGLYQQLRINPFNNTYWTNWPTVTNNYVQPPSWWAQTYLIIMELQPAQ